MRRPYLRLFDTRDELVAELLCAECDDGLAGGVAGGRELLGQLCPFLVNLGLDLLLLLFSGLWMECA